eukprot:882-Pelagococcus_subviridis.AAC.1
MRKPRFEARRTGTRRCGVRTSRNRPRRRRRERSGGSYSIQRRERTRRTNGTTTRRSYAVFVKSRANQIIQGRSIQANVGVELKGVSWR